MIAPMGDHVYTFAECDAKVSADELEEGWQFFYRHQWPAAVEIKKMPLGATKEQYEGVDRIVRLRDGSTILVEDKNRFKNEITGLVYDDLLAEIFSNAEAGRVGWTVDPIKKTDWVGYAIWPLRKAYLIQAAPLREAVLKNEKAWSARKGKGYRLTKNVGFTAKNLPVSWKDVWASGVTFGVFYFDKPHYRAFEF